MNNRNMEQQLRYLEEICIPLHRAGFETQPLSLSCLSIGMAYLSAALPARAAYSIGGRMWIHHWQRVPFSVSRTSPPGHWSI